jgi:hypothetical protein
VLFDIQANQFFCQSKGGADKASGVYESAMGLASKAVESDEPLLHPPSHVALACVLAAADAQGVGKEWQQYVWQHVAACAALVGGIDAAMDGGLLATLCLQATPFPCRLYYTDECHTIDSWFAYQTHTHANAPPALL